MGVTITRSIGPTVLQSAVTAGDGLSVDCGGHQRQLTFYVTVAANPSAGALSIEEAPTVDYDGDWSVIQAVDLTALDGECQAVHVEGAFLAVRARVSTTVEGEGASVSVTLVGV